MERKKLKVSVISNENKQINFIFKNTNSIEDKQINSTNLNNINDPTNLIAKEISNEINNYNIVNKRYNLRSNVNKRLDNNLKK